MMPLPNDGPAHDVEFRNAWGFGAMIWSAMQRHLGWYDKWYETNDTERKSWLTRGVDGMQVLWDLYKDPGVPADERIAMALTFDFTWVPAARVPRVADALRNFESAHRGRGVCHLAAIARAMEEAIKQGATGIRFYGQSVSENPWHKYDEATDTTEWVEPSPEGAIDVMLPDVFA